MSQNWPHLPVYFPVIGRLAELVPLLEVTRQISGEDGLLQHPHHVLVVLGREACNESAVFSI